MERYSLQTASWSGHGNLVQMLLDQGTLDIAGGRYGRVTLGGHGNVVQLLLDRGADVKAHGGEYDLESWTASSSFHICPAYTLTSGYLLYRSTKGAIEQIV